jgi:CheY-like chemotaxis protein
MTSCKGLSVVNLPRAQSEFTIRALQRGDALQARRLIEAVWHEHFGRHPDPFVRDFIYSRLSDIDDAEGVYRDQAIFLCAVAGAEVIGTGAIKRLDHHECEMTRMFVASNYRGRGIGRAIAEKLIKFALSAGYNRVRLSSNKVLAASHRLYESMGFQSASPWELGGETYSRYFALQLVPASGAGATFKVWLPLTDERPASETPPPIRDRTPLAASRVLLVEDNKAVAEVASDYLEQLDLGVVHASSAEAAITLLNVQRDIDFVLTDIVMPGMTGLELGRLIREHHPELPVILATGYSDQANVATTENFPLINKPYSLENLERVIRECVGQVDARFKDAG